MMRDLLDLEKNNLSRSLQRLCQKICLNQLRDQLLKEFLSEKAEKWWTVSTCYNEIDTLRDKYSNENDHEKLKFLDELNNYVMSIQKKYENS